MASSHAISKEIWDDSIYGVVCRRKKFESPQQPTATQQENPLSARGLIRRTSLRDKSGMTLARLEADREKTEMMRSWSKEDVSSTKARQGEER